MRVLIIVIALFAIGCENTSTNNEDGTALKPEQRNSDRWDHSTTYEFTGTASERQMTFQGASLDLQMKINELKRISADKDVKEKLDEANEKIAEAREKLSKADEKSIAGNTNDAIEKIEDAREKLDEAREKYMDALEKMAD